MRQRQRPTLGRADGSRPWRWERIFSRSCCMRRADHASTTTAAASCCSSARRTWATGKACRRVFAGDDFLTVASADDMARVTTWRQQRHGIYSARAARRTLRAVPSPPWPPMPPRKARRGHDAVAAGSLRAGSRAGPGPLIPCLPEHAPRRRALVLPRPRPITGLHPLRPGENLLLPSAPSSATGRLLLEPACRS
jgi:hypothetical protein